MVRILVILILRNTFNDCEVQTSNSQQLSFEINILRD